MPIRLLFLNTRDQCGADVAVHLSLMKHFMPDEVAVFAISNSEASDAEAMQARLAGMPHVTSLFLPLGRPASSFSGKSKVARALAYVPSVVSLARAAAFIRRHRIQVVHATDRPRDASYVSLLGMLTGAASVVHVHAPVSELSRPALWGIRNSTAIFGVSDYIRDNLIQRGFEAQRTFSVHNAVEADHFDPDRDFTAGTPIRRQFNIPAHAPIVGIAARLNPWKGHIELIGAASMLRTTFPDLHVVILGDGLPEFRSELERMAREGGIAERVHFGGHVKDVRPFLQECALFVHPSYTEPFGLAIVEAMSMRKPVIACGTGGVAEIITHGRDGWLVEERSATAVAAGMETLLKDSELCRQLGTRARETVRNRFSPRQQCAAVARKYAGLMANA